MKSEAYGNHNYALLRFQKAQTEQERTSLAVHYFTYCAEMVNDTLQMMEDEENGCER